LDPINKHIEKQEILSIARGSEEAFARFFNRYKSKIYGVAVKMLKSSALAEDTVQEVFLKIWLKREELTRVDHIEGYLFIIARNHILNTLKSLAKEKSVLDDINLIPGSEDNTDHLVREKQYHKLLEEVIDQLPPQQKMVYRLSRLEGLSNDKIASKLGISPFTVRKHLSQALKFLRKNIKYLQILTILLRAGSM
jgi:RNA polymerase sigma-70 factor (ECF subfamily)